VLGPLILDLVLEDIHMHPELFKLGPLTVYSYGLFVALGFLAGSFVASYRAKKTGISPEKVMDLNIYTFIAGILGARLFYILTEFKYYLQHPGEILKIWEGGLVFYGGLLLGLLFFFWYIKKQKLDALSVADIIIPGVALGQAIGRLGCFMRGCCYGKEVETWGIVFPDIGDKIPHIPTQLYESGAVLLIFCFLMKKKAKYKGEILVLYLFLYAGIRFFIEFFRGDERGPVFLNTFSVSQVISLGIILLAVYLRRKYGGRGKTKTNA